MVRVTVSCCGFFWFFFGNGRWVILSNYYICLSFGQVKSRGYFDGCEEGTEVYEERCVCVSFVFSSHQCLPLPCIFVC